MAYRILNSEIKWPSPYPKVERKLPTVKDRGWTKVGDFTLRNKVDLMPQPGLQEELCRCEANLIFICGAATSGKAQPYDAKVLTPNGFVEMGKLEIGDTITGFDGKPQKVLQIFEQGEKDVYKVIFDDGSQTECCNEHLWNCAVKRWVKGGRYSKYETMPLHRMRELMEKGSHIGTQFNNPTIFKPIGELPIDPYVLGAIIGDGCVSYATRQTFAGVDIEIIERIRSCGYSCVKSNGNKYDYKLDGGNLTNDITKLGLRGKHSWDKFIPEIYKYSSIGDRLALIQGLFDTDGSVDRGNPRFNTTSKQLAYDIQWVIRSLGGRCCVKEKTNRTYKHKGEEVKCHDCYELTVNMECNKDCFFLPRKKERANQNYKRGLRRHKINSIVLSGKKQCRCLLVSNSDHLYITDDFIVTHNTYGMYLKSLYGMDKPGFTAIMFSYREKDSKKGSSIFRDAVEVLGNYNGCEYAASDNINFRFPKYNSQLQLANFNYNINNPTEWADFKEDMKKKQASLIMVDEMTKMLETAMLYLFSRNRDSSGMTPQFIGSFNPEYDHFTRKVLQDAGYLDNTWHVKKDMEGKIKYFHMNGNSFDNAVWGDTPEEVVRAAGIKITDADRAAGLTEASMCKTFTVFTGEASDNRILVNATGGQSVSNLSNSGDADVLKGASFAPREKEEININRNMIHALWENPINEDENMYATMDVSSGKAENDKMPFIVWRGLQMIGLEQFSGEPNEVSNWIKTRLQKYNVAVKNFAYDATGHGYWMRGLTEGIPITWNKRVMQEYDKNGNAITIDEFYNLRSQLLGKMEVLLKSGLISCAIPQDKLIPYGHKNEYRRFIDILFDEMNLFITLKKNGKTYYRSTEEFKDKFKFSPDIMTSIVLRAVFELDTRERKQPKPVITDDAYDDLYRRPPRGVYGRSFRLNYR